MLLAIDVGNTNTVLGVYQGAKLENHWRIETSHARTHEQRSSAKPPVRHLLQRPTQRRDHAGDHHGVDIGGIDAPAGEELPDEHTVLVARPGVGGLDPPVVPQGRALEHPDDCIGVSDVDGE